MPVKLPMVAQAKPQLCGSPFCYARLIGDSAGALRGTVLYEFVNGPEWAWVAFTIIIEVLGTRYHLARS